MPKKKSAPIASDDAPGLTQEWFDNAEVSFAGQVVRPGQPPIPYTKKLVSLRLDQAVIEAFQALGRGWQTRVNDVLREHVAKTKTSQAAVRGTVHVEAGRPPPNLKATHGK